MEASCDDEIFSDEEDGDEHPEHEASPEVLGKSMKDGDPTVHNRGIGPGPNNEKRTHEERPGTEAPMDLNTQVASGGLNASDGAHSIGIDLNKSIRSTDLVGVSVLRRGKPRKTGIFKKFNTPILVAENHTTSFSDVADSASSVNNDHASRSKSTARVETENIMKMGEGIGFNLQNHEAEVCNVVVDKGKSKTNQ
ncbi:hypothetical protein L1987_44433 [Smallanthus sonchifolius]|uniref:Uncharacterized protein n=1 Tax=Smallanthus sonchifolius TaxID=185202 RepID=A0ACB9GPG3_9ASTR|nr:hypothetical protein L1987_44433 [Smallanthus sonchifolius]